MKLIRVLHEPNLYKKYNLKNLLKESGYEVKLTEGDLLEVYERGSYDRTKEEKTLEVGW